MSSGFPAASSDPAPDTGSRPRRRSPLPRSRSVYEWTALALVGLSAILGPWLFGGVRLWSVGPLSFLVFSGTALYLLRPLLFARAETVRWPPAMTGLVAFLAYGALMIPRAAVPYDAAVEMAQYASYVAAFLVWVGLSGEQGRWRWLLALLLLTATFMAWYSIIQHAHESRMVLNLERPEQYGMRASGAYFCPNHFANLLALLIPMAVALALLPAAGFPLRLLSGYAVLVMLPPLYLSGSRSAWLGVIAGVTTTIALLGLRRSAGRAVALLVVTPVLLAGLGAAVWAFSPMMQERVADALQGNVRLNLWRDTLAMIADNPLLGFGPASYLWVYPHYWHHLAIYINPQFAHNDYLHLVAEFGLLGAGLLLGALGYAVVRMIAILRGGESERGALLIAGFLGACATCAVHACFDYNFHLYGNVQMLAALGGITAASLYAGGHLEPPRWIERVPGRGALLVLVPLLLALFTARAVATYAYALRGDFLREEMRLDEAAGQYRRAIRIHPGHPAAHRGLGEALSLQAFWNLDRETKRAQIEEAMTALQRARELNPRDTAVVFGIGRLHNLRGESERALETFRQLVELTPHHRDYWVELGLQLRGMGRDAEALEVFEKARAMGGSEQIDLNIQFLRARLAAPPKS